MTPQNRLRLVFMGTAPLAAASLKALLETPAFEVVAVVTQPDRPKGRDLKPQPSTVKQVAVGKGLPVLQPERARQPDFVTELAAWQPELIVVAAYGQILPQTILDLPRWGCLNVHASLLPRWRGAAPIQWAILAGDAETGVTIMKMDAGLDTGDMLTWATTPILPEDNSETLHDRLATLGAGLLVRTIPEFTDGRLTPQKQPAEGVTYARKITKEDGCLDWSLGAAELGNRLRAFSPWPGAYTWLPPAFKGALLKIWDAEVLPDPATVAGQILRVDKAGITVACGQGSLRIKALQREGGRRLTAQEFLAGTPLQPGMPLGVRPG